MKFVFRSCTDVHKRLSVIHEFVAVICTIIIGIIACYIAGNNFSSRNVTVFVTVFLVMI